MSLSKKNILCCDFEGMPKYGVTPLLSPFDIDFDRPLLAASSLLLVTRTPGLPRARQQCLISSPNLGIALFGQEQIKKAGNLNMNL